MNAGRLWAYGGVALGAIGSIAANIAHSYVPPTGASPGWHPEPGSVIAAGFWPIALLVAVEVLVRIDWPAEWLIGAIRFVGVGLVALVAAVVSYRHLSGLLHHYREDPLTVAIGPLAIDGLMLVRAAALLVTRPRSVAVVADPIVAAIDQGTGSAGAPTTAATASAPTPPDAVAARSAITPQPPKAPPATRPATPHATPRATKGAIAVAEAKEVAAEMLTGHPRSVAELRLAYGWTARTATRRMADAKAIADAATATRHQASRDSKEQTG